MTTTLTPAQKAARTRKARREAAQRAAAQAAVRTKWTGLCIPVGDSYRPATRDEILDAAAAYMVEQQRGRTLVGTNDAIDVLRGTCAGRDYETFAALFLDVRCRVINVESLFRGTIDGASVYPREVVRRCLEVGAASVIFAHNHPSGVAEPSTADRAITTKLSKALALIDVRVLDHLVLTETTHYSFAEHGLL